MKATESPRGMSSPCSTSGIASPNGSPDTKLTAFSPEDVRSKGRPGSSAHGPVSDAGLRKLYSMQVEISHSLWPRVTNLLRAASDPFLVPTSTSRVQLSPTAAAFTPVGMADTVTNGNLAQSMTRALSSASYLAVDSIAEVNGTCSGLVNPFDQGSLNYGNIGSARGFRSLSSGPVLEKFDSERRSRALVIENVPTNLTYMALAGFFNRREFGTLKGPVLTELSSMGKVYVSFTDSREAKKAIEKVRLLRPEWRVFPLTAKEYVQHTEPSLLSDVSDYEGQLLVTVYYDSRNPTLNQHTVTRSIETIVTTFGDMKAFTPLPTGQEDISEFHLEFFNTRDAENVMTTLNGSSVEECILEVSSFKPDIEDKPRHPLPSPSPARDGLFRYETPCPKNAAWTPSRPNRSPFMELSPTGRSTVPPGEHAGLMNWMSRAGEGVLLSPRRDISRFPELRVSNQNAVDIERIRLGLDVRTTIMLRNIPNKIDQTMLKAIVDETSRGKYDFMYLRIDFANNCNVGYAFINFEDFVNVRAGRTWNCFNSDKVAEVSYATIQGKDCLVQKFRNSSVMLEHPSFRPKIFHTGSGHLAGTEDRFPGPDNPSKMRRSIENAEHVGLFAPRVGQQYRDEQRRRRSQFDRGTTAAEREIVYVRTLTPKHSSGVGSGLRSAPCTYPAMKMWYDPTMDRGPRTS
ncbi:meiosis protein MEI2 [Aspergillus pseudonomiae]|uniref:Meiosis protein MEI2 n=1 Tax=Aspergillus pseudonomiae TaxID=1506151 RepID=A0A5N6HJG1_9EURO|nr:meiosis protein MEI2 [Aspergillus pseudonomiae]KAB8253957.1 meiosis protein MEI2 [Aspergillus pseudonomiae]KAE8397321.1 meiosis protein MEI2 [Aspergillus pseudonomiae]